MSSAATSPSQPARSPWDIAADLLDPPADPDRDLARKCAEHLPTLIREAWPIVEPATPFVHGWHLDTVAYHLEAVSAGELPRLIVNVPPRTMKSLTVGVFWPAWEWLLSPHIRWLFASYAQDLSTRDSVKCRRLIESKGGRQDGTLFQRLGYQGVLKLLHEQPWDLTGDQNVKTKYENTETGMRLATSVGGVATGEGGDRVVVDDPLSAKQARSDAERNAANTWWDETMTTRFNNQRAAAVIVMQRLHEDDLTGHLAAQGGWHHLCLPAEYEPKHPFVYPDRVTLEERDLVIQGEDGNPTTVTMPGGRALPGDPRTEEGELLEPVRLSRGRLLELRKGLGSYGYAGQMLQRPSPGEGGMFKRGWWQYWTPDTLPPQWQRMICSWDMTFGDAKSAEASYVVGQVWGVNGAQRYLLGQIRTKVEFTDAVKAVQAMSAWKPEARAKLVEKKANGAAVISTLKDKIGGLIAIEPEGGKYVRAGAIEPYVEAKNVFLPASDFIPAPPGYEATSVADFIEEAAVFPNGTHDDQVDAMSQALNWLEHKGGKVTTEAYKDGPGDTVVIDGDLRLVGEQYIDKP